MSMCLRQKGEREGGCNIILERALCYVIFDGQSNMVICIRTQHYSLLLRLTAICDILFPSAKNNYALNTFLHCTQNDMEFCQIPRLSIRDM